VPFIELGALSFPEVSGAKPQWKSILVHFGLKIRHLMTTILMIFPEDQLPKFHPLPSRLSEVIFKDTQFDI